METVFEVRTASGTYEAGLDPEQFAVKDHGSDAQRLAVAHANKLFAGGLTDVYVVKVTRQQVWPGRL